MRGGTTPLHTWTLPFGKELIAKLKATYKQCDKVVLEKHLDDFTFEGAEASVRLTQEDTFLFDPDYKIKIQLRGKTMGGEVLSTDPIEITYEECLDDEVL